jgi:subtilase family serine protease
MQGRTTVRGAVAVGSAAALVVAALATAPAASAAPSPSRHVMANTAPKWLAKARDHGHANTKNAVSLRVYLAPQGGLAAEEAAATAVSTPGSASYGQFITPAQFYARYSPTSATVAAVRSWVNSTGLHVTGVEAHNRYVTVSGTVAAAQSAFDVSLHSYTHDGQTVQAPTGATSVPTAVSGAILAVSGLDTTKIAATPSAAPIPPPDLFRNGKPCSIYYGQIAAKYQADFQTPLPPFQGKTLPYAPCGYTGPQFRSAYENNSALDGSGVTIASTLWYNSSTIRQDVNRYAVNHGDGAYRAGQFKISLPPGGFNLDPACGPSDVQSEQALDTEAMHAMAPGANIIYYSSASCFDNDLNDTLARVVNDNKASIVSNSWGEPEESVGTDIIVADQQVLLQGAMQGISFLFSSGDNGDELLNTGLKQADYPASQPLVTAVGGTTDAIGPDGTFEFQSGWGTLKYSLSPDGKSWTPAGFLYGSGGGYSALFNRPTYQDGVVPATAPSGRAVPDVAMDGDVTTGMLIGLTQAFPDGTDAYSEYRIGGTSVASPLFAGMTALRLQHVGHRLGLLNPTIYGFAGSTVFKDIKGTPPDPGNVRPDYANGVDPSGGTVYSVRTFNQDGTLKIANGWDDVTGIGSPTAKWLTAVSP